MLGMYLTIREYRMPAGQVDQVVTRVDDDWLDQLRKDPGFVSYYVAQVDEDRLVSVTVSLDEAAGERIAEASAEWVGAHLIEFDVQFIEMRKGSVAVHGGT